LTAFFFINGLKVSIFRVRLLISFTQF